MRDIVLSGKTKGSIVCTRRRVFSKNGMFTRLSFSFENLELPNQNRHGCGGAGLARTVIDGSLLQKMDPRRTQRGKKTRKESKQTRVMEKKKSQRAESGCQGGSPFREMRGEEERERL